MRWRTVALSAPGVVTMLTEFTWPASFSARCAVGSVNAASVTPARLLTVPNWAMPVIVNVRGGPASRTRTRWPTANPYCCAVPASMTTSSLVVGGRPAMTCRFEIWGWGSKLTPIVGAPPVEIASPSRATNCA